MDISCLFHDIHQVVFIVRPREVTYCLTIIDLYPDVTVPRLHDQRRETAELVSQAASHRPLEFRDRHRLHFYEQLRALAGGTCLVKVAVEVPDILYLSCDLRGPGEYSPTSALYVPLGHKKTRGNRIALVLAHPRKCLGLTLFMLPAPGGVVQELQRDTISDVSSFAAVGYMKYLGRHA